MRCEEDAAGLALGRWGAGRATAFSVDFGPSFRLVVGAEAAGEVVALRCRVRRGTVVCVAGESAISSLSAGGLERGPVLVALVVAVGGEASLLTFLPRFAGRAGAAGSGALFLLVGGITMSSGLLAD